MLMSTSFCLTSVGRLTALEDIAASGGSIDQCLKECEIGIILFVNDRCVILRSMSGVE